MKIWKRLCAVGIVLCMLAGYFPAVSVYAADAKVSIALSASSLKEGDSLTVTVSVKCSDAIGSYSMAVTYDSSVIEYTGGAGSGGSGTVNIAGYGDGSAKSLKASLKFKAVGSGSTGIATTGGEVYSWDEASLNITHASAKVSVGASATASKDNSLSALTVSPGTLSPAFDAGTTKYAVSVGADVSQLVVSASAKDAKAKVSVSGNKKLKAGQNTVKVTVTAESGDKKTYVIICTRAAASSAEDTSTEKGTTATEQTETGSEAASTSETETTQEMTTQEQQSGISVLINGFTYTFADSAENLDIPEGFEQTVSTYQGQQIMAFAGPDGAVVLVCLLTPEGDTAWFLYDETTGGFLTYCDLQTAANRLFIMEAPDTVVIPDDFRSVELDLNGMMIPGYMNETNSEIILVYARKLTGEEGLYYYDTIENGFVRYIPDPENENAVTQETAEVWNSKNPLYGRVSFDKLSLLAGGSLIVLLILLIAFCVALVKNARLKKLLTADTVSEEDRIPDTEKQEQQEQNVQPDRKVVMAPTEKTDEQKLEEQAAKVVAKLALDEESESEKKDSDQVTRDTAPMPIIHIDDDNDTLS